MKILAIRGAGLASLSAPFDVSLDAGALAQAGVFAIVGPTGAGKSTLLDALFLALFGDTPRLTNQQRVRLPGQRDAESITTRDARGLARGDASLAFAEVDFRGVDGRRYRARWEVQRKRGGGAFKKPVHALSVLIDGEAQRIGGTKTEVLGHVVARLGLDFDQFRRSVVLAQGEIAAFLHAPDRDRAELLERITGTEIYGEISREIHLETVRQRERVGLLVDQLAAASVMDPSERRAAEQAHSAADLAALQAEQARQIAEAELERHQRALELSRERDEADAELARIEEELRQRDESVRTVRSLRVLGGLVPLVRALDRASVEVVAKREAHAQSEALLVAARAPAAGATADRDAAARARDAADVAAAGAASALADHERALSIALAEAGSAGETLSLDASLDRAREQLERERADAEAARERALHAMERGSAQAARWPSLDAVLARVMEPDDTLARAARVERERIELREQAAAAVSAEHALRASATRAERAVADGQTRIEASSSRARRAERALTDALLALDGASHDVGGPSAPSSSTSFPSGSPPSARAPKQERPRLARSGGGLELLETTTTSVPLAIDSALEPRALLQRCNEARRAALAAQQRLTLALAKQEQLAQAQARWRAERARERIDRARFAEELGRLERELTDATSRAKDAEDELDAALRAGHAAALRARLSEGQPCEVCGSTEHPGAKGDTGSGALADAGSDHAALRLRRDDARAERESLAARHLALRATFQLTFASPSAVDGARGHDPDQSAAMLKAQLSELELALAAVGEAEHEMRDAHTRLDDERRAGDDAAERATQAERALRAHAEEGALRARKASALDEEATSLGLAILETCAASADVDVTTFLRDAMATRAAASEASARLPLLTTQIAHASERLDGIAAQRASLREPLQRAQQACARAADAEARALAARAAHARLAAEAADAQAALATASARLDALRATIAAAEQAHERASAALEDAAERAAFAAREVDEQVAQLDATDVTREAHVAEARALGQVPAHELTAEAQAVEALEKARDHATSVRAERRRKLAAHADAMGAEGGADQGEIEQRITAMTIALEARRRSEVTLRGEQSRCEHLLERDDVARVLRADKANEVDVAQGELAVWEDLLDALGSADGKKLRVHAQRLTLRALVREASLHLTAIAPRYAIEVVEGGDLAIQVSDRALGGEVRALGALSGGETFLVSLALALALRGLTAEQVQIASLFIDEGFGSLDAQSLDVVLSALDALEATGRQVGIVSHVPEVKERFAARIEVVPQGGGKSLVRVAV